MRIFTAEYAEDDRMVVLFWVDSTSRLSGVISVMNLRAARRLYAALGRAIANHEARVISDKKVERKAARARGAKA